MNAKIRPQQPEVAPDVGVATEDRSSDQVDHQARDDRIAEQSCHPVVARRRLGAHHRERSAQ